MSGHYYYFVTDLLPAIWAPMKTCLLADYYFFNFGDLISYGSGWRKAVLNQCLEFNFGDLISYGSGWRKAVLNQCLEFNFGDLISYGSGWRKAVLNQCLEFAFSEDSHKVFIQPPCAITRKHWQPPYHFLNAPKYCTHWYSGRNRCRCSYIYYNVALPRCSDPCFLEGMNEV